MQLRLLRNLSLSLTLRYLQAKAYKDADSKGSVSVDLGASYHRSMGILDEMASWTIGFQAANLGSKLDGQKLPAVSPTNKKGAHIDQIGRAHV